MMMSRPSADVAAQLIEGVESDQRFDNLVLSCADQSPLIDEGDYDAIALRCRKEQRFGRDLLAFKFRIVTQGSAFGLVLPGYCNLGVSRGRQLPERSKLASWLRRIQAFAPEISSKKVHLAIFGRFQFVVHVATSRGTGDQLLPTDEHYSQITEILGVTGRITGRGSGR